MFIGQYFIKQVFNFTQLLWLFNFIKLLTELMKILGKHMGGLHKIEQSNFVIHVERWGIDFFFSHSCVTQHNISSISQIFDGFTKTTLFRSLKKSFLKVDLESMYFFVLKSIYSLSQSTCLNFKILWISVRISPCSK